MVIKRLLLVAALCLLLSGMRDPFQPPTAPCQSMQTGRWHYHGVVAGGQTVGFLRDSGGRWHRAAAGERLVNGWQVIAMSAQEITLAPGEGCLSAQWRLKREGAQNEKMDSRAGIKRPVGGVGASSEPRHVDAG